MTLLIIMAALIPVTIIIVYMQFGTMRLLKENEIKNIDDSLQQTVDSIENQIEIYSNLIYYLSYSQNLRNILRNEAVSDYDLYLEYTEVADPLLQMPQIYHQEINAITLYADNIGVAHAATLAPLSEAEEKFWYKSLNADELLQWFVKRGSQKEILAVRKFYDEDQITAALVLTLDYNTLLEPFRNLLKMNTGGLIADQDGNVVYSGYSMEEKYRPAASEVPEYIRGNYTCSQEILEETGWIFYLYRPAEVITESANHLIARNIPIVLVCLIILVLIGYIFSKRTVSRLELLTENMNLIHMGSRKVTVFSDSKDEVGVLVRSFKRMMDEINKLISEVYESKIELQKTEMKALQAQINPHFLYNSLSIINWKAIEAGETEISKVTLDLSTYYRTSLNRGETMTTVENEINNIRAYIRIQLIMHDYNFKVEEEIEEEIYNEQVPKLILQPLVENAIEHGLDISEKEEKCLRISAKSGEGFVVFQVMDNGEGMTQETAAGITGYQSKGYGVRNVKDRIFLLYGENGRIVIQSKPGEGTCVEIRIPVL